MHRIFANRENIDGEIFYIPEEDQFHLGKVNKLRVGEIFEAVVEDEILTLEYLEYEKAKIIGKKPAKNAPKSKINLFFSILKGDKNEFVIQKCTEIGITDFYPIVTKRTISNIKGKEEKKLLRWQKVAEEACKQSKADFISCVNFPTKLSEIEKFVNEKDLSIVFYEDEKTTKLKQALNSKDFKDINIVIGPEGGFEESEIEYLKSLGFVSVSLGKKILKADTASVVACANIIYELELY